MIALHRLLILGELLVCTVLLPVTPSPCTCDHTHLLQFARTELIQNNQNPQFTKAIQMDYRFEEMQKLKFSVYDLDNESTSLADDDFLGFLECSLGEVCVSVGVCLETSRGEVCVSVSVCLETSRDS